jgi:hypothetical protein
VRAASHRGAGWARRGRMLPLLLLAALLGLPAGSAMAADLETGMQKLVENLDTREKQCGFLQALCHAAVVSIERANSIPATADLLSTRQDLRADQHVREAEVAAEAVERKAGKRLACFDEDDCRVVLPRRAPAGR